MRTGWEGLSPPLGMVPSRHVTDRTRTTSVLGFKDDYTMNQWMLMGAGDIGAAVNEIAAAGMLKDEKPDFVRHD